LTLQDRYANKSIWLFGRIINQLYKGGETRRDCLLLPSEQSAHPFSSLWKEVDSWHENRPPCMKSVIEVEPSKGEAFPFILFGNPSASKTFSVLSERSEHKLINP
jgi:hypothetical protein